MIDDARRKTSRTRVVWLRKQSNHGGTSMKKYACNNCVFTITCEELPEDFVCPVCGSDAEEFVEIPE